MIIIIQSVSTGHCYIEDFLRGGVLAGWVKKLMEMMCQSDRVKGEIRS